MRYHPEPELPPEKDAGDYYSNKAKAATYWGGILKVAREIGAPREEIRWIEQKLESARYVGD